MSVHTCQLLMSEYVYICIYVHVYISRGVYLYMCPACVACVWSAVFHVGWHAGVLLVLLVFVLVFFMWDGMQVHVGACIIVCVFSVVSGFVCAHMAAVGICVCICVSCALFLVFLLECACLWMPVWCVY